MQFLKLFFNLAWRSAQLVRECNVLDERSIAWPVTKRYQYL